MTNDQTIKFGFVGDVMLGGSYFLDTAKRWSSLLQPLQNLEAHLKDIDILFINLEGPVYVGKHRRQGVTTILSNHPEILRFLKERNICVVNLANNHTMDYEEEGLNNTIRLLNNNNIMYVGAGIDEEDAGRERIFEYKGRKVCFLAYTSDQPFVGSVIAGQHSAGCTSYQNLGKTLQKIRRFKNDSGIICVSLHWGYEYFSYPSPEQVALAHQLVDAGADFVIGHHPHVLQGIEHYNGSLIVYSLGNLYFPPIKSIHGRPHYQKEITKEFMIVKSEVSAMKNITCEIIGGKQNRQLALETYNESELSQFRKNIVKLSEPIKREDYNNYWIDYRTKREKELINESVVEAFKKIAMMSFNDLIKTITLNDVKRNFIRLFRSIIHS